MVEGTKQIQPARDWCATVGGDCANCIHLSRLSGGPATQFFWGSQPCVPAAWLAERLLFAGDIKSNPGPKPTLKTLSHTRTQPPPPPHSPSTLAHQSNPLKPAQPPLSLVYPPPKTPTSIQPPKTPTSSPLVEGMSVVVNVMLSLMNVMSPPPALCNLSVRTAVKLCIFGVLVFWL